MTGQVVKAKPDYQVVRSASGDPERWRSDHQDRGIADMRVHYLKHVPFEGLGAMLPWFKEHEWQVSLTELYRGESLPSIDDIDWLIVMGGPMSANDEAKYSWLKSEKDFIGQAIETGKSILGVCLGSQLIADVLGSKIYKNREPEIGWFPIELSEKATSHELGRLFPPQAEVFHWHGETFDLPQGSLHLARSQACENQAFVYGDRVLGLQFHLETTQEALEALVHGCADELTDQPFIQSPDQMLSDPHRFTRLNQILNPILKELSARMA